MVFIHLQIQLRSGACFEEILPPVLTYRALGCFGEQLIQSGSALDRTKFKYVVLTRIQSIKPDHSQLFPTKYKLHAHWILGTKCFPLQTQLLAKVHKDLLPCSKHFNGSTAG